MGSRPNTMCSGLLRSVVWLLCSSSGAHVADADITWMSGNQKDPGGPLTHAVMHHAHNHSHISSVIDLRASSSLKNTVLTWNGVHDSGVSSVRHDCQRPLCACAVYSTMTSCSCRDHHNFLC